MAGKAGRPKMYGALIQVSVTDQMRQALAAAAAFEEVTEAEYVRRALKQRLQK